MTRTGGCLCGAVRYELHGEPRETVHCHCRMCRKSSGAPVMTWTTFAAKDALTYTRGAPAIHRSSQHAQREFCGACGTQLAFRGDRLAVIDITTGSLDEPDSLKPRANTWAQSRIAWMHGFDTALPDFSEEWPGDET